MANMSQDSFSLIYNDYLKNLLPDYVVTYTESLEYHPWLFAFLGSLLVGLSGIFPLLVIPIDDKHAETKNANSPSLKVLLSFAVGALLGDVFLHLLPEAWLYSSTLKENCESENSHNHVSLKCGLWVLCGLLLFIIVEKLFAEPMEAEDSGDEEVKESVMDNEFDFVTEPPAIEDFDKVITAEKIKREKMFGDRAKNGGAILCNDDNAPMQDRCLFNNNLDGSCGLPSCGSAVKNGVVRGRCLKGNRWIGKTIRETQAKKDNQKTEKKHVSGYLNLMANSIDNFTHGLAVGGSFLVSFRVGMLSTFAILVHEIPHEVGDFAILLRSGFSRWEAAKAQLATATTGLIGAMTAVLFSGASNTLEAKTSWILPFTAGGFLHIALITVLPDLLKEESPLESLKQLSALIAGIVIMGVLTAIVD